MDLYWLDLETTGLDPKNDKLLEIAIYKATLENPFDISFMYQNVFSFNSRDTVDEFVKNMHTKNGLFDECENSSLVTFHAERDLLKLIPEAANRKSMPVMAGSSIHFDAAFLKEHMPTLHSRFSHRHYDVSAVKLFCQSLGMPEFRKAEAHRAVDDIIESVAHAKECAAWLKTR